MVNVIYIYIYIGLYLASELGLQFRVMVIVRDSVRLRLKFI